MKLKKISYKVICVSCGYHEIQELITTVFSTWRKSPSNRPKCKSCGGTEIRTEKIKV